MSSENSCVSSGLFFQSRQYSNLGIFESAIENSINNLNGAISSTCSKLPGMIYNYAGCDISPIEKIMNKCISFITHELAPLKLSLLHLAVINGNSDLVNKIVQIFINSNIKIDQRDHKNYTPLHHAAMFANYKVINLLINQGADKYAKNDEGGTYEDVLRLTRKISTSANVDNFSLTCLKPGVKLVEDNIYLDGDFASKWATQSEPQSSSWTLVWQEAYNAFKKNPPKISVAPVTQDDSAKEISLSKDVCGVTALEKIKAGTVITEYLGQVMINPPNQNIENPSRYWLDHLDGQWFTSAGAMINDGFPNAKFQPVYNVDGMPKRYIIVAIQEIQAGDQIILDYNYEHSVKRSERVEFRPKALNEFCKSFDFKNTAKVLFNSSLIPSSNSEEKIKHEAQFLQLNYLFSTPHVFLDLIKNQRFTKEEIGQLAFRRALPKDNEAVNRMHLHTRGWSTHHHLIYKISSSLKKLSKELFQFALESYKNSMHLIAFGPFTTIQATGIRSFKNFLLSIEKSIPNKNQNEINAFLKNKKKQKEIIKTLKADLKSNHFKSDEEVSQFLEEEMKRWEKSKQV